MKKVTGFDVARAAHVSQPTVSRALRNTPGISPETRERVMRAARELSYIPSDAGRSLSMQSTKRIAVVSEALTNPYYPELVEPLRKSLGDRGYRAVIVTDSSGGPAGLEALADGSYDGVILTTTRRDSTLPRDLTERGMPHVLLNRVLDHPESDSCGPDNRQGAAMIAELLVRMGHDRIALVQGPVSTSTGRDRADALAQALRAHGRRVRRELTRRVQFSHDEGYVAGVELLGLDRPPTAIACGNDVIAMGVLSAAKQLHVRVPDDLSVVGFDDIRMASWPFVDLTTIHCDLTLMAHETVTMLLNRFSMPQAPPVDQRIPVQLRLRSTHGPAPGVGTPASTTVSAAPRA